MENCPLTGLPCTHKKCIHVTEVGKDYVAQSCKSMCMLCGVPYASQQNPSTLKTVDNAVGVFDVINNLINETRTIETNVKTCPVCGFTINDISDTARVGCAECYNCFKKELEPFIANFHSSLQHVGKKPKNRVVEEKPQPKLDIETLKKEMAEAIKREDYELAAKLRDLMKGAS